MDTEWQECYTCDGEGHYQDLERYYDDPYSYDEGPPQVTCRTCRGVGMIEPVTQEIVESRKLFCAESGIAPGSDDYNDIMENG